MTITKTNNENGRINVSIDLNESEFYEQFTYCEDCGKLIFKTLAVEIDGHYFCNDCVFTCDCCGSVHPRIESYTLEDSDDLFCEECYNSETYICDSCHRHFRYEDNLRLGEDDFYYCDDCYEDHKTLIQPYHTFKDYGEPSFCGTENRADSVYMGFELEVDSDTSVDTRPLVKWIDDKFDGFFHFENDGSLSWGWENISQPASLTYHLNQMDKYSEMFSYLISHKMRSHDTNTCGLHVHLDRKYFGKYEDSAIGKLLFIFEKFRTELMLFSRRTTSCADSWARSRKTENTNKDWIKEAVKNSKEWSSHSDRYYAVNLTNQNTIEIRLWRGTLNVETFEAAIKFTSRLADMAKNTPAVKLAKMSFEEILGNDSVILSYWNRIQNRTNGGEQ